MVPYEPTLPLIYFTPLDGSSRATIYTDIKILISIANTSQAPASYLLQPEGENACAMPC